MVPDNDTLELGYANESNTTSDNSKNSPPTDETASVHSLKIALATKEDSISAAKE